MTIFNQIGYFNASFEQLAKDPQKKADFVNHLNEFGKTGWKACQIEQVGNHLLVIFFQKEEA